MHNANLFFPHTQGEDLQDLYEERLFLEKQFFTSRGVLSSVFKKRIEKIQKSEDAFRFITGSTSPRSSFTPYTIEWPQDIPGAYTVYQLNKSKLYGAIFQAHDFPTLCSVVEFLLKTFVEYCKYWQLEEFEDVNGIILSKEPDPVLLAQSIATFQEAGGRTVRDLQQLTYEGKEILLSEAKRLSLWRKKENTDGDL